MVAYRQAAALITLECAASVTQAVKQDVTRLIDAVATASSGRSQVMGHAMVDAELGE